MPKLIPQMFRGAEMDYRQAIPSSSLPNFRGIVSDKSSSVGVSIVILEYRVQSWNLEVWDCYWLLTIRIEKSE